MNGLCFVYTCNQFFSFHYINFFSLYYINFFSFRYINFSFCYINFFLFTMKEFPFLSKETFDKIVAEYLEKSNSKGKEKLLIEEELYNDIVAINESTDGS